MFGLSTKQLILIGVIIVILGIIAYLMLKGTPSVVGAGEKAADSSGSTASKPPQKNVVVAPTNAELAEKLYNSWVKANKDNVIAINKTTGAVAKTFKKNDIVGIVAKKEWQTSATLASGRIFVKQYTNTVQGNLWSVKISDISLSI